MDSKSSQTSIEEIETSSGGVYPISSTKAWNQRQSSGDTVAVEEFTRLINADRYPKQDTQKYLRASLATVDVAELAKKLNAIRDLLDAIKLQVNDDLLSDEIIPTKPLAKFKVKARIANVRYVKASMPFDGGLENDLLEE
jgi:hypothetical protein